MAWKEKAIVLEAEDSTIAALYVCRNHNIFNKS